LEFLIVVIFIIVALVIAYFGHLQLQRRREELGQLAASLGWQFTADSDYSHDEEYAQFEIFRHGHSRYAYNTLFGAVEVAGQACRVKMGDFHYQVTTHNDKGSSTHTYQFSYLLVHLPYQGLPTLFIRREGIFDALSRAFGFDDIDFESAEFSKRYYVKSSDKRFAYDVIHPAMMEYLLANEPPTIDIEEGRCCLADGRQTWSPDEFRATLESARRFFELWPKHLTSTLETNHLHSPE
jgi:hypothetical protein